jgi:hypothetical protein
MVPAITMISQVSISSAVSPIACTTPAVTTAKDTGTYWASGHRRASLATTTPDSRTTASGRIQGRTPGVGSVSASSVNGHARTMRDAKIMVSSTTLRTRSMNLLVRSITHLRAPSSVAVSPT